jgi:hypothetical protein
VSSRFMSRCWGVCVCVRAWCFHQMPNEPSRHTHHAGVRAHVSYHEPSLCHGRIGHSLSPSLAFLLGERWCIRVLCGWGPGRPWHTGRDPGLCFRGGSRGGRPRAHVKFAAVVLLMLMLCVLCRHPASSSSQFPPRPNTERRHPGTFSPACRVALLTTHIHTHHTHHPYPHTQSGLELVRALAPAPASFQTMLFSNAASLGGIHRVEALGTLASLRAAMDFNVTSRGTLWCTKGSAQLLFCCEHAQFL